MTVSPDDDRATLLETLEQERRELAAPSFGYGDAWAIGSRVVTLATQQALPIAVGVVLGRQRLFHAALPGTSADNDDWLERKFRTVTRFGQSSLAVATRLRGKTATDLQAAGLDPALYAMSGGAVPLLVGEAVVGAVGVSGLTGEEDHALVVSVLREWRRGELAVRA